MFFIKNYFLYRGKLSNFESTLKSPSLWNIGRMEIWKAPLFQHSKFPLFHYSVKNDFSEWTQLSTFNSA